MLTLARGHSPSPFRCLCQKLFLSLLYFNKTLLHKNSERSSLVSGPRLNPSPPEAKNPGIFRDSATIFQGLTYNIIGKCQKLLKLIGIMGFHHSIPSTFSIVLIFILVRLGHNKKLQNREENKRKGSPKLTREVRDKDSHEVIRRQV